MAWCVVLTKSNEGQADCSVFFQFHPNGCRATYCSAISQLQKACIDCAYQRQVRVVRGIRDLPLIPGSLARKTSQARRCAVSIRERCVTLCCVSRKLARWESEVRCCSSVLGLK